MKLYIAVNDWAVHSSHVLRKGQVNSRLILDQAPCHTAKKVQDKFDEYHIRTSFVPARLTCFLQPADVAWFSSFKAEYRSKWTNWYITDARAFTKSGKLKSPGYAKVNNYLNNKYS